MERTPAAKFSRLSAAEAGRIPQRNITSRLKRFAVPFWRSPPLLLASVTITLSERSHWFLRASYLFPPFYYSGLSVLPPSSDHKMVTTTSTICTVRVLHRTHGRFQTAVATTEAKSRHAGGRDGSSTNHYTKEVLGGSWGEE